MMAFSATPEGLQVGVVGIEQTDSGIIAMLLMSGHQVVTIIEADAVEVRSNVGKLLDTCTLSKPIPWYLSRLMVSHDYQMLSRCGLVLECLADNLQAKVRMLRSVTAIVPRTTLIASTTTTIPIANLQHFVGGQERFLGIRFAEPVLSSDQLEITCGELTDSRYAQWLYNMALHWNKKPALLQRDINGTITSRLIYANYRQIIHPVVGDQPVILAIRPQKRAV